MNFKRTLLFLVILLVLIGIFVLSEKQTEKKEKAEEVQKKLFSIPRDKLEEMTIAKKDEVISLKKVGDKWNLTAPVEANSDQSTIGAILSSVVEGKRDKIVEEKPQNLDLYGLETPGISFSIKGEGKTETLLIGNQNPTRSNYFAKNADNNTVFLIPNHIRDQVNKTVYDLRDKSVLTLEVEDVSGLEITQDKTVLACEKIENQWRLIKPYSAKGDKNEIEKLLREIKNAQVSKFIAEKPDNLAPYQLDKPSRTLKIIIGEDKATKTLHIGKEAVGEDGYYAMREGASNVFLVKKELLDKLPKSPLDLRSKTPIEFSRDNVVKMEFRYPDLNETYICQKFDKDDGKGGIKSEWELIQPAGFKSDSGSIFSTISSLEYLKAKDFVDAPKKLSEYGLDKPSFELKLWEKDATEPKRIFVGKKLDKEDSYYVGSSTEENLFIVEDKELKKIKKTLFDLRDKILMSYSREEIRKIELELPDGILIVEGKEKNWRVTQPADLELEQSQIDDIIWAVDYVRMSKIAEEGASIDLAKYGLDKPKLKVKAYLQDGRMLGPLCVGNDADEPKKVYANLEGSNIVAVIDSYILDELPKDIAGLRKK